MLGDTAASQEYESCNNSVRPVTSTLGEGGGEGEGGMSVGLPKRLKRRVPRLCLHPHSHPHYFTKKKNYGTNSGEKTKIICAFDYAKLTSTQYSIGKHARSLL